MKRSLIALALIAASASAPAFAATDTFEVAVDYNITALNDADKIQAEYDYIREQVSETCQAANSEYKLLSSFVERRCTGKTMDKVVSEIGHDALTALHVEETAS